MFYDNSMNEGIESDNTTSENKPKKSFIWRFWWIGLIFVVIIIGLVTFMAMSKKSQKFAWPSTSAKYITAMPVDLAQIEDISKYRSCAGHDRSGYSFDKTLETERSMKHYLYPVKAFQGTIDKVKVFAPFDGTVSRIDLEKDNPYAREKSGNGITFTTPMDPNAAFSYGHIYFVKEFKVGDNVTAGELVGYAALGNVGDSFDIDLTAKEWVQGHGKPNTEVLGSAFDHMTDSVLAEFAKYGITTQNMIDTKEYRDAHPCNYQGEDKNNSPLGQMPGEGWITLKH